MRVLMTTLALGLATPARAEPPPRPAILLLRCGAAPIDARDILRAEGVAIVSECNAIVVKKPPERKY